MGIRGKLLGSLLCLLGALALGVLWLLRAQMLHNYTRIEMEHAQSDLRSVVLALENESKQLAVLANDWGHWTELYTFAADRNPDFISANINSQNDPYRRNGIAWLGITDAEGQLIAHLGIDPARGREARFPELEFATPALQRQLTALGQRNNGCGIVNVEAGPMLLCGAPILTSEGTGPSRGTVLFGKLLNEAVLASVRQTTNSRIELQSAEGQPMLNVAGQPFAIASTLGSGTVRYVESDADYRLHWALHDLGGNALEDVVLIWPRDIRTQMDRMLGIVSWQLALLAGLAALGMGLVVEVLLVRRLKKMDVELKRISGQRDWHGRLSVASQDEIGALATHANDLLGVIQQQVDELELSAMTDALTGLANRRAFDHHLAEEIRRQSRHGRPLSLMMCDVDYFKRFNDCYGHQAGDMALQAIARCLKNGARRGGDLPVRLGGEEFALLFIATEAATAVRLAEEIRRAVEALAIPHSGSDVAPVLTLSFGVSELGEDDTADTLYFRADTALYAAKQGGRNRVMAG
ncbi:putative diguanylate cyclase YdaM [Andreprevotia sp. IGB-42]|uniref:GGDEF domain-containing protein n=1 Tax=Andreprevotia sp. IGB-42 TaxID=2497473 RepID=UPI00135C59F5|nr:diguanylate cyclase [Andreprevotia sp. IGB-42]KAF0814879.1 putative diguanylate cyclase YdaM [Andreprevotia sp. IGB-42]